MPLTKDELLKPRIKCVIDYPGNIFGVDQILQFTDKADKEFSFSEEWFFIKDGIAWGKTFFDQYQLIFKELRWDEEREKEDMPEFIKDNKGKIFKYFERKSQLDGDSFGIIGEEGWRYKENCQPATEEEYNAYINQKQQ